MTTQTTQTKKAKATPTAEKVFAEYADALKAVATAEKVYTEKPTKTNGKALATAKRRLAKIENAIDEIGIITAENVQTIGERIAIRALKTCYQKGGQPFIYSLYCGLVADITENKKTGAPLSDGYDIAQTACAYLCEYIGKGLHDKTADGQTDKDGNPVAGANVMDLHTEQSMELRQNIRDFVDENMEVAALLLKSWMKEGGDNG